MYTLLYIEDSEDNIQVIERVVEVFSAQLVTACSAWDGLEKAEAHHPDLILMDLGLPDMHGLEALHKLKKNPQTAPIPVIVVTGNTHISVEDCLEAGAVDHILKPFTLSKLMVVLHKHAW
jgi:CheY-like chemotaxis protein